MDLLSNLIAYSSINTPESKREDRSLSVSSKLVSSFGGEKSRPTSKSLSKLELACSQAKIDPKQRILYRIAHSINKKIRKNYYTFFVLLQQIKKQPAPPKQNPQLSTACCKLETIIKVILTKLYEQEYKPQIFQDIKHTSRIKKALTIIDSVSIKKEYELYGRVLYQYFRQGQIVSMKMDVLMSAVQPIEQKVKLVGLREGFERLQETQSILDLMPIVEEFECESSRQSEIIQPASPCFKQQTPYTPHKSKHHSPISISKEIPSLHQSTKITPSLTQYQPTSKCYKILTSFLDQPFPFEHSIESVPKMLPKQLQHKLPAAEVGDEYDRSSIFREEKLSEGSIQGDFSSKAHTLITEIDRIKQSRDNSNQSSVLSYINYIPSQASFLTQQQPSQRSDGSFGHDAVCFKNSLVMERESIRKQNEKIDEYRRKNFMKRKQEFSTQEYVPLIVKPPIMSERKTEIVELGGKLKLKEEPIASFKEHGNVPNNTKNKSFSYHTPSKPTSFKFTEDRQPSKKQSLSPHDKPVKDTHEQPFFHSQNKQKKFISLRHNP